MPALDFRRNLVSSLFSNGENRAEKESWMKCWIGLGLACALMMGCVGGAMAQGASARDRAAFARMPEWVAQPMGYAENYVVDLRGKLPVPGEQQMQDCTSWALAYAMKSFMEVKDQGWQPNAAARTFSPRFIYNQINEGKDEGSLITDGLKLMKDKGCATLATCPYEPGEFRGQPTAAALAEAALFKIRSYKAARSKDAIRAAVQRGHVVPIGVIVTPIFMGGHWEIYTRELHDRGLAQRKPDQPHGRHAMCVVGFDDSKEAFLVMNSWGKNWGKNGYFWLSYTLADQFNGPTEEIHFMDWAVVVDDERMKVEHGPGGKYVAGKPDPDSLAADVEGDYRGYDAEQHQHQFYVQASLVGDPRVIDGVDHVEWSVPVDPDKPEKFSSDMRDTYFAIMGTIPRNEMTITGKVSFKDKSAERTVRATYKLPAPTAEGRNVTIATKDWYEGKIKRDGKAIPSWWIETELTGSLTDLKDVVKVTWNMGRLNATPETWAQTRKAARNGKFGYYGSGTEPNDISADVAFNDGSTKTVHLSPAFQAAADETVAVRSTYRPLEGTGANGRTWFAVSLDLYAPREELFHKIDHVEWYFGPPFENARQVASWSTMNFFVDVNADREFRVRAKVFYHNGVVKELSHWVALGKSAKYADPRRIEMQTQSTYLGMLAGKPNWRVRIRPMGDWDTLDTIASVTYKVPAAIWPGGKLEVSTQQIPDGRFECSTSEPFNGSADIVFKDGLLTRLQFSLQKLVEQTEHLALAVEIEKRTLTGWGEVKIWKAALNGPELLLKRILRVDYDYKFQGHWIHTTANPTYKETPAYLGCGGVVTEDSPLRATIWFNDGSQMALFAALDQEEGVAQGVPDGLQIRLRERFWGIEDGKPTWLVKAELVGSTSNLAAVRGLKFQSMEDSKTLSPAAGEKSVEFKLTQPGDIYAVVETAEQEKPLRIGVATTPLLDRTEAPLILRQVKVGQPHEGSNGQDLQLYLDGWESELREVKQVEYHLPPALGSKNPLVAQRGLGLYSGFALATHLPGPSLIDAVATMNDGTTRELSVQAGLPAEPFGWDYSVRYFKKTAEGLDQYLVDFHLVGEAPKIQAYSQAFYESKSLTLLFRGASRSAWGPLMQHQAIAWGKPKIDNIELDRPDGTFIELPGRALDLKPDAVEVLAFHIDSGMTWPGQKPVEKEWIASLVGPEETLEKIDRVAWRISGKAESRVTSLWREGERAGGFSVRFHGEKPPVVEATITLIDGSHLEVKGDLTEP
jgi:hypothetical protein